MKIVCAPGWRGGAGRPALLDDKTCLRWLARQQQWRPASVIVVHSLLTLCWAGDHWPGCGPVSPECQGHPSPVTRWKSPRPIPSLPFIRRLFIADMFVGNFVNTIFWAELPLAHLTPTQDSHRRFYQRVGNTRICGRHSTGRLWSDWKFQSIEFDFNCCWWNSTFIFLQSQSDTSNSLNPTGRISESHFWTIV